MIPRRLTPAYSPVTLQSILRGAGSLVGSVERREEALEQLIVERYGSEKVALVDSGTSALALALAACAEVRGRRPVALPGFGCYDLATAADAADVRVRLYDVDPVDLSADPGSLERVVAAGVSAVVVAHLYGLSVELGEVRGIAAAADVPIIEDAAQGFGGYWCGAPLGSVGAFGVLSFGRGKGLTGGGGGALLIRAEGREYALRAAAALPTSRNPGLVELLSAIALKVLGRPRLYTLPAALPFLALGETRYRPPHPPRRAPRASLGIVAANWGTSLEEAEVRKEHGETLRAAVQAAPDLREVRPLPRTEPAYLRLPVLAAPEAVARLSSSGARRLGIMPSYPSTLADLPGFSSRCEGTPSERLTGARHLTSHLYTIPTHSRLRPADLREIEALVRNASGRGRRGLRE